MHDYSFERKIMQTAYPPQDVGAQHAAPLRHAFQSRIRPVRPAYLGARLPLEHHGIGREIEPSLEQTRAYAVRVHRHALLLELADLVYGEAAGDDDPHLLEALGVQRAPDVPHELRIHAGRLEGPHLRNDRLVHERLRRVEPDTVEPVAELPRPGERRPHAVVVEVHQRTET